MGAWRAGPWCLVLAKLTVRMGACRWCVPHNSDCTNMRTAHENTSTFQHINNCSKCRTQIPQYTRIKTRSVVCRRVPWSSMATLDCRTDPVVCVGLPSSLNGLRLAIESVHGPDTDIAGIYLCAGGGRVRIIS